MTLVVVDAHVEGLGRVDIHVDGGRITATTTGVPPRRGDDVVNARGGAVVPGLHDHHIHLHAAAAAERSVHLGPPDVRHEEQFTARLRAATPRPDGWVRGTGYHESVAGLLGAAALDAVVADRPVRVQHRSGALWVLNSAALRAIRADVAGHPGIERDDHGHPTGRLWRADDWLRTALPAGEPGLPHLGARLARYGVTGVTDADPLRPPGNLEGLRQLPQRVHVMGPPDLRIESGDRLTLGPVKIILDDDRLPGIAELAAMVAAAHAVDRPIAVHCVTRAQLVLTLAALDDAGARRGDRIEHGAVIPVELINHVRQLGLVVVTQPNFVAERGDDYLADVDADDLAHLYRAQTLVTAGIPLAAGTDAPFGGADPWAAVRAAMRRRTRCGAPLGPGERLGGHDALALFLGRPEAPALRRVVAVGEPADLCVLGADLAAVLDDPSADAVVATIIDGRLVHQVQ